MHFELFLQIEGNILPHPLFPYKVALCLHMMICFSFVLGDTVFSAKSPAFTEVKFQTACLTGPD